MITSASDVYVEKLSILTGGVSWQIADLNNLASSIKIGILETDTAPGSFQGGFLHMDEGECWIRDIIVNGERITDKVRTIIGNTDFFITSMDPRIMLLTPALTDNRTITEPTIGIYPGTELLFVRTETSTGEFNWIVGESTLSTPNTYLRRKWTGTEWVTIEKGVSA